MIDIAEAIKGVDMYELAHKTNAQVALSDEERDLTAELDARFKEIGETGHDPDHEIAQFLRRTVNEEIYNAPDEMLDLIFDRGSIGEFDDYTAAFAQPQNTLVPYEAGFGGNVPKSYLDNKVMAPTWRNFQIDTQLSFTDLRRNGWKTVSLLSEYAVAALKNNMYATVFNVLDAAIVSGAPNYITESTTMPTAASMDQLATYIAERTGDSDPLILALYKYILAASKLESASDSMKDEMYKNGVLSYYGGIPMKGISSAKKIGGTKLMLPDRTIFGIAGKIGSLDMKGELHTYQTEEPQRELINLYFKDFTFGYAFNNDTLQKVAKIVCAAA